jgi:hypothetical protein
MYADDENIRETSEKGPIKTNILMTLDFSTFLLKYLFSPRFSRDICCHENIHFRKSFCEICARQEQNARIM